MYAKRTSFCNFFKEFLAKYVKFGTFDFSYFKTVYQKIINLGCQKLFNIRPDTDFIDFCETTEIFVSFHISPFLRLTS